MSAIADIINGWSPRPRRVFLVTDTLEQRADLIGTEDGGSQAIGSIMLSVSLTDEAAVRIRGQMFDTVLMYCKSSERFARALEQARMSCRGPGSVVLWESPENGRTVQHTTPGAS